jgi:hypothetical protein
MHERADRGFLSEIGGFLRRTAARAEQTTQTIERLTIGVVEFDGQFRFEIPSLNGQGRLTPKPSSYRVAPLPRPRPSRAGTRSGQITVIRPNP